MSYKTEILSPAGSPESLYAAVKGGADAVYVGSKEFSARASAQNFDREELKAAVRYCHLHGVLVYQAINTIVCDDELKTLERELEYACRIGIDGLIVQDLAVISAVRTLCPEMPLHASTQMTVHTKGGIKAAKALGLSRAVLARELSYEKIKELCGYAQSIGMETEVFVHGALCMSVSGQCYMSAMYGSRSANRGQCAQACRLPCSVSENEEHYALSLKDLSLADSIGKLCEAGVSSLKIEGRMKRPEYCYLATKTIKSALIKSDYSLDRLASVFSRSGFTDGYFKNRTGADMFGVRRYEDVTAAADVLPQIREEYKGERKSAAISFEFRAKRNEPIRLLAVSGSLCAEVFGEAPQEAKNLPTDENAVSKQLLKLGDTIFTPDRLSFDIENGLYIPLSSINELRREACSVLCEQITDKNTPKYTFSGSLPNDFPKFLNLVIPEIRISFESAEDFSAVMSLDASIIERCEFVTLPVWDCEKISEYRDIIDKIILALPRYIKDEEVLIRQLEKAHKLGFSHVMITNTGQIPLCDGFEMHGAATLNISNSLSLEQYAGLGLADTLTSFEITAAKINRLGSFMPTGVIGYGRLPLMLCVNCPIRSQNGGCKACKGVLYDRKGAKNPVACKKEQGYVEILNAHTLNISDRQNEFHSAAFFTLMFTDEKPQQVLNIISAFEKKQPLEIRDFTRGLYFRGIK